MIKRLIVACVAVLLAIPITSQGSSMVPATVQGKSVNVRQGPSTNTKVLDTLKRYTAVVVTDIKGNWAKVSYLRKGEKDIRSGWVALSLLRLRSKPGYGGSAATYTTSNGARFDLTVDSTDLDCREGYDGYDSCDVDVSISVTSNYNGNDTPTVTVTCEADLTAYDRSGWGSNKNDSESTSIYGRSGYETLTIDVRLYSYDPVVRVKLKDVTCTIDSVY